MTQKRIFIFHLLQSVPSEDNVESVLSHLYFMARYGSGNHYNKLLPAGTAVNVTPLLSTRKIAATHSATHRLDESLFHISQRHSLASRQRKKKFHLYILLTICRILMSLRSY